MERNIEIEAISDGKLYHNNDMVKIGCNDCAGCFECCQGMGTSITLDPYDIYQLTTHLNLSFEGLLVNHVELNVVDGMILPNLKLDGKAERCSFLDENGRCNIHDFRPGMCRLFPLGRIYEEGDFHYFVQIHECKKENKTKVKIKKWLGIPDLNQYETFIKEWHYFILQLQQKIKSIGIEDLDKAKQWNMMILQEFFLLSYDRNVEFYVTFKERLHKVQSILF
ncbi:MAG: YkgJ family cysteine cluster protein [Eubacteriales bacterium]